jgi:hypothetical protein
MPKLKTMLARTPSAQKLARKKVKNSRYGVEYRVKDRTIEVRVFLARKPKTVVASAN